MSVSIMATAQDICYAAARALNAVQLGEDLSTDELNALLSTWQRLINSEGLDAANIHTIKESVFGVLAGTSDYTMGYDPNAKQFGISSVNALGALILTLDSPHGLSLNGGAHGAYITGGVNQWAIVNGPQMLIPQNATDVIVQGVDGTSLIGISAGATKVQIAGKWGAIKPSGWNAFHSARLEFLTGSITWLHKVDAEGYAARGIASLTSVPRLYYPENDTPFSTVHLYPIPDVAYNIYLYTEKPLESPLALTDTVVFDQGYERYWITQLALEAASMVFDVEPTAALMAAAERASTLIKRKNRHSPNQCTDSGLNSRLYRGDGRLYFENGGRS